MQTSLLQQETFIQGSTICPDCAEPIPPYSTCCSCKQSVAAPQDPRGKWHHSTTWVILALLTFGPFALPMVWFHPRYKSLTKAAVSILVISLTAVLCYATYAAITFLIDQIHALGSSVM
ncbi:MAG: hypothetical protein JW828_01795 [Sedimentisphaerales bacterium]|nr:hypothetical protein [Sedimentisphaerales bacterium]